MRHAYVYISLATLLCLSLLGWWHQVSSADRRVADVVAVADKAIRDRQAAEKSLANVRADNDRLRHRVEAIATPKVAPEPKPTTAKKVPDSAPDWRYKLARLGLTPDRRKEIFRQVCAAEDRADWEANRLHDIKANVEESKAVIEYTGRMKPVYREEVLKRLGLTPDQYRLISVESLDQHWPLPEYPSCDVKAAAKSLPVTVYFIKGDLTYHRKACRTLDTGDKLVPETLSKALDIQGSEPCNVCTP